MLNPLAAIPDETTYVFAQAEGIRLSEQIQTEEAASSARSSQFKMLIGVGCFGFAGFGLFLYLIQLTDTVLSDQRSWMNGLTAATLLLVLVATGLATRLILVLELLEPLALRPPLAEQFQAQAALHPAVRAYLARVAASGRQLRVFDVAVANNLGAAATGKIKPGKKTQ